MSPSELILTDADTNCPWRCKRIRLEQKPLDEVLTSSVSVTENADSTSKGNYCSDGKLTSSHRVSKAPGQPSPPRETVKLKPTQREYKPSLEIDDVPFLQVMKQRLVSVRQGGTEKKVTEEKSFKDEFTSLKTTSLKFQTSRAFESSIPSGALSTKSYETHSLSSETQESSSTLRKVSSFNKKKTLKRINTTPKNIDKIPPSFEFPLQPLETCSDLPTVFSCKVLGLPQPTVRWYRNTSPVLDSADVILEHKNNFASLTLQRTLESHAGLYYLEAVNDVGKATTFACLTVLGKHCVMSYLK